jgi:uncharacterized protein
MVDLRANGDNITFSVRVQPRASRSQIAGEIDGMLKIRVAAPPVEGEANEELIRLIAKLFEIPRANVALIAGQSSKNKLVRVSGISLERCKKVLDEALV